MGNGFLTWCALAIAILISVVFFSKKGVKNNETIIFKYMLITNIVESTLTNLIVLVAFTINSNEILILLNRLDVITIITWCSLMFFYIYNVSKKNKSKKLILTFVFINIIMYLLALILDVNIINSNGIMDSQGPLTILGLVGAIFYIIAMIITVLLKNNNQNKSKYTPLYFLIILIVVVAILRAVIPEINFISLMISFINLIMIFTIENPDIKLVEELIENRKIIERSSEEKSAFLFKMSQGIREPVHNIDREIEKYKNGSKTKKDTNIIINNIYSNNQKIDYLVNDVLGITSFDRSNIKKSESTYNIYSLLEDIKRRGKTYIEGKIDYNFSVVDNIPTELYGDKIKIKQVLMSVIINAIKNTKEGYVHVDVSSFTKYDVCRLVITVEDSGCGMDIVKINNILEQDLEITEKEYLKIQKLDVDLPLSYKIIKSLGGTMYIKSDINKGTELIITLDQYIANHLNNKNSEYLLNIKRVLIVDDKDSEIRKIKTNLEHKGYDVSVSMYGDDCIEKISNKEYYDIILINDEMSIMNGIEIVEKLNELHNKSKKIVLLNKDKLFIADHYLEDGFDDFIDKTNLLEELNNKL